MSTRTENITYGDFTAPAGTVVANIIVAFTATNSANSATQTVAPGTASITQALNPDTYTVTAQAVDPTGAHIGNPATETFTISAPATVTVSIPTAVSGTTA